MTDIAKSRVLVFLCMIGLCLLIGCGAEEEAPVYDTTANPHGFPKAACDMLDAIEAGQLATYDVITEAFGRLYLENQELLENRHWQEVIKLLGRKFHHRADEMLQQGVTSYTRAAGFYLLAAFANPNDARLSEKAQLFTAWKETVEKLDYNYVPLPTSHELTDRLDFLRCFVLGDSLQRRFAEEYLVHQLLDSLRATTGLVGPGGKELSLADKALITWLWYFDIRITEEVSYIGDSFLTAIVTYRVVPIGSDRYRLELYFRPSSKIEAEDLALTVLVDSTNYRPASVFDVEDCLALSFEPIKPTSTWKPLEIQVAAIEFTFPNSPKRMVVTLDRTTPNPDSLQFFLKSGYLILPVINEPELHRGVSKFSTP